MAKIKYPDIKMSNGVLHSIFNYVFDINSCNWVLIDV